jgi:cytochrome c553
MTARRSDGIPSGWRSGQRAVPRVAPILVICCLLAPCSAALAQAPAAAPHEEVTATSGASQLARLNLPLAGTSLGRIGLIGAAGAPSSPPPAAPHDRPGWWLREGFSLTGADLYRLDCRSCHGARGAGLPPEILPILGLVREMSSQMVSEKMAASGQPADPALAEKTAARARRALRERLAHGGAKMIPFDHLAGKEFDALLGFLYQLSDVPEAEVPSQQRGDLRVHQSADRLGEHLAKGTCQICHDATSPSAGARHDVEIPSLAAMTEDYSFAGFIRGAHHLGTADRSGRGRGPRLEYLSDDELAATYVYLIAYPPGK